MAEISVAKCLLNSFCLIGSIVHLADISIMYFSYPITVVTSLKLHALQELPATTLGIRYSKCILRSKVSPVIMTSLLNENCVLNSSECLYKSAIRFNISVLSTITSSSSELFDSCWIYQHSENSESRDIKCNELQ